MEEKFNENKENLDPEQAEVLKKLAKSQSTKERVELF